MKRKIEFCNKQKWSPFIRGKKITQTPQKCRIEILGIIVGFVFTNKWSIYFDLCKNGQRLSRRLGLYLRLRDKIALELDSPEKHLLSKEDMLNMIGNVIETTPRHAKQKSYRVLNQCSPDGSKINDLDVYDMPA